MHKLLKIFITVISILVLANTTLEAQRSSVHGRCFTPKDSIKILMVFVGFGSADHSLPLASSWPVGQEFPNVVQDGHLFYDNFSLFDDTIVPARDVENISRFYYEMSNKKFKLIAKPVRINIADNPLLINSMSQFYGYTDTILAALAALHNSGNINLSNFDNRRNRPDYYHDYSKYNDTDKVIDYVAVIF